MGRTLTASAIGLLGCHPTSFAAGWPHPREESAMPIDLLEIYESAFSAEKDKWDSLETFAGDVREGLEENFENAQIAATIFTSPEAAFALKVLVLHAGEATARVELRKECAYVSGGWYLLSAEGEPVERDFGELIEELDKEVRTLVRAEARFQASKTEPESSSA
jgi:hypothetical protein